MYLRQDTARWLLIPYKKKLLDLKEVLPESNPIKYAHRIDNVLFSHAGISKDFVDLYVPKIKHDDVDTVLNYINNLGKMKMWYDGSPIWLRPQYTDVKMYKSRQFLQVVGHTPMETITKKKNVISCDVFSTYRDGKPIGTEEFLLLDTITWDYSMVNYGNY